MRIISFKCYQVPPRWLFLKIETDEGISGWGEPIVEGKASTVQAAVEELMEHLIGKSPLPIEDHWNVLFRGGFYRGGPILMSALAGIDQALWDIKGKYYQAPVYELMGGACRDKTRVYSWIGGDRPADIVKNARALMDEGITAVKMNGTEEMQYIDSYKKVEAVLERVASLREAFGYDLDIGIDFHGRVHKPMAKVLVKELEQYHPMFIEEPVLSENQEAFIDIAQRTSVPIATGERMFHRWDFKSLLQSGAVDIIQPDLSHAGGITECKKIASMAEAYDVALAPHCPLGPIALSASLHLDATCHNAFIQEQSLGIHYNVSSDLLDYVNNKDAFAYEEGYAKLNPLPGLGIDINEEVVAKASESNQQWRNPIWRHKDGTFAEW